MKDMYSMEYTELRNAPHFIFNGYHTRDFNVNNVQVDSGLAKDTFLATRNLTVERTRYSDRSYLLGYTEEPLKFKVRLVFDEHKFTMNNYRALKRLFFEPTYREMKFDNDDESNLHIIMYAMVTGTSEATHNVINDGYVDLEFETNSSKKYSEIMEDEYDFSKPASVKILEEYSNEIGSIAQMEEKLARDLKQWVARTNYANIEEVAKDENNDRLPDGWKLISGTANDIKIDNTGKMTFKDIHIRKRINPINNRNYYLRVKGKNGQIRVHENDYDINTMGAHQFKYRRNLLGNSGTFDLDSSGDGIGEGWVKENPKSNLFKDDMDERYRFYPTTSNGTLDIENNWWKFSPYLNMASGVYTNLNPSTTLIEGLEIGEKYTIQIEVQLPPSVRLTHRTNSDEINNGDTGTSYVQNDSLVTKIIKLVHTFTATRPAHNFILSFNKINEPMYLRNYKIEKSPYPTPFTNSGRFSIDLDKEEQKISGEGRLKTQVNLIKGNKYLLVAKTPQSNSYIRIQDKVYTDRLSKVRYIPFEADSNKKEIVIGSLDNITTIFSHTRIYNITDVEYSEINSQLLLGDNLAFDVDFTTTNNTKYGQIENTNQVYEETSQDIWKYTKTDNSASPPVYFTQNARWAISVKPKESLTLSVWVKHDSNNVTNRETALRLYNSQELLTEAAYTTNQTFSEWTRISVTYTNNTADIKDIHSYLYPAKDTGCITYFTSPQIEFGKTMTEWRPTPDKILDNKYPHFDAHPYFDIDYSGTEGYIEYIDLWELNDLNKKKLDSGVPIEDIVGFDYRKYKEFLDNTLKNLDVVQEDLMESFDKLNTVEDLDFQYLYDKIVILSEDYRLQIKDLDKGNNMKNYQWEDVQPHYLKMKQLSEETAAYLTEVTEFINLNQHKIDTSSEIGNDIITVYNFGDDTVYPTFDIESTDGSDIMIRNNDTGEFTIISDNIAGEKIKMNGENEQITTSRPAPYYKYDTHDDTFIRLKTGHNTLEFAGNYKVKITYQFVLL
ncbi:phage tail domain-containing protein [Mammaliicoccus lentus]|uniref:phage tail domain-containing protein n=2 Tax=Mammaliicoccus lentus TaxID=42858 RepID=UPI001072866F|nr:phage tail domain-containing protein [Mammaliicoccus lentus]